MANPILRWAPAAGAVVVVVAAAVAIPMSANASSTLPTKTPAQVLELVANSHVSAFSGTVEQTSNLGLPSLPSTGPGADSSTASSLALLTGTHSIRIYADGPSKQRVQVLDSMAERDVVHNGKDVWVYDSKAQTAEHSTLHLHMRKNAMPSSTPMTPAELATKLLAALQKTSTVSVGSDVTVAGRTAYDLVLTPRVSDSLIGSISIAVDPTTGIPLGVDVNARGSKTAAVSVQFSQLTVGAPAASLFRFTPPSDAKVTQVTPHRPATKPINKPKAGEKPTVTGSGWDSIVVIPKQSKLSSLESSKQFSLLTTPVAGGHLLHTSLVNILFTTDGRIIAGSVSAAHLEAVAEAK